MSAHIFETLLVSITENIATITLNRPQKLNAFTELMADELIRAIDLTDSLDEVRAVIITGSGRAFCAGADLSNAGAAFDYEKLADAPPQANGIYRDGGGRVTLRFFDSLKPLIAAVNGPAVGVGLTMQLAMDIRLASTEARFGCVFARRGLVPEAASSWFLPRLVGMQTALEWCYSGRIFPASEALACGLVRSVHAPEDLLPAAHALAREFAAHTAPVSVALTRQMMWRLSAADHPMAAHKIDSRAIQSRGQSHDIGEGVRSFLEKRPAHFPDLVSRDMPDFFPWFKLEIFE